MKILKKFRNYPLAIILFCLSLSLQAKQTFEGTGPRSGETIEKASSDSSYIPISKTNVEVTRMDGDRSRTGQIFLSEKGGMLKSDDRSIEEFYRTVEDLFFQYQIYPLVFVSNPGIYFLVWMVFLIQLMMMLIAAVALYRNTKEKRKENFLYAKQQFRKQWKRIRSYDDFPLSYSVHELRDTEWYRREEIITEVDTLIDFLDDIFFLYQYDSSLFQGRNNCEMWKSWEKDFTEVFSKNLCRTAFLRSTRDYSPKFNHYILDIISRLGQSEAVTHGTRSNEDRIASPSTRADSESSGGNYSVEREDSGSAVDEDYDKQPREEKGTKKMTALEKVKSLKVSSVVENPPEIRASDEKMDEGKDGHPGHAGRTKHSRLDDIVDRVMKAPIVRDDPMGETKKPVFLPHDSEVIQRHEDKDKPNEQKDSAANATDDDDKPDGDKPESDS